ncbi:MAG: sigma-70 family RNA polymerase sigma factor [Oscillospiraceae bacterium]|nr:sigma-70 family RNA polymerase sigma factor [Oscillospiraceae bacterium]
MRSTDIIGDRQLLSLFSALRSGSMSAFEEIYSALSKPVYTVALRIAGERTLAEDITQEVFIKLFSSPPDGSVKKPRAYIFAMAHNAAINSLKKISQCENIECAEDIPDSYSLQTAAENRLDIAAALAELPQEEREVVALRVNGGFKFREIARIMGIPAGTAAWRWNKAINTLRQILGDMHQQ